MEALLTRLFDFQAFERNRALQDVIDSVHARCEKRELDFDDMEWIAAAGDPEQAGTQAQAGAGSRRMNGPKGKEE